MENIKIFENEDFGTVRAVQENSKVFFCGKDVATALGYVNTKDALIRHCKKDGVAFHDLIDSLGRTQKSKFIDEGNLYRLIAHSNLPAAEKFEAWIFDEVLPTIRKTGGYVANEDAFIENYLPFADENTKTLFKLTLNTIDQLNHKIEADKPLVEFANHIQVSEDCISMNDMAKLASNNGIKIGRNKLFAFLRNEKVLKSDNIPYQRYIESQPWFQVKESTYKSGENTHLALTTVVTSQGQHGIINMLKKSFVA